MFRLCSEKEIPVSQLKSTAAVCLLIATKWNEKEDKVPMRPGCLLQRGTRWNACNLKILESRVLTLLDWSLKTVLPIDFVQYFLHCGVVFADDTLDSHHRIDEHPNATTYIRDNHSVFFDG